MFISRNLLKMMEDIILEPVEIWNVIILLVQATILIGQLLLSKQINKQTISKEKGYFIIDKTNAIVAEENESVVTGKFFLKSKNGISFYVAGNADVIVCGERYSINSIIRKNYTAPSNAYFTLDKRFNKYIVEIEISDNEEKQKQLDFEFIFKLQNVIGYKYAEKIDITFEKMEGQDSIWQIRKYNTMFLKWNEVK